MGKSLVAAGVRHFPFELIPENGDYRASPREETPVFNDLELYLMGLVGPEEVQPHLVFVDQEQTVEAGSLVRGPVIEVTIDDIVAAHGPRDPDVARAPKQFHVATIVVSETLLSPEALSFYDYFAARAALRRPVPYHTGFAKGLARPFFVATGERATVTTGLGPCTGRDVPFMRGETNADGRRNVADAVFVLTYLLAQGAAPACTDAADTNDDGTLDIADAISLLGHLFAGTGPLPDPFAACGPDPTPDELSCGGFGDCMQERGP
jgi:hypothetical protein